MEGNSETRVKLFIVVLDFCISAVVLPQVGFYR